MHITRCKVNEFYILVLRCFFLSVRYSPSGTTTYSSKVLGQDQYLKGLRVIIIFLKSVK